MRVHVFTIFSRINDLTFQVLYFPQLVDPDPDQHWKLQLRETILTLQLEVQEEENICWYMQQHLLSFSRKGSCWEHYWGLGRLGKIKENISFDRWLLTQMMTSPSFENLLDIKNLFITMTKLQHSVQQLFYSQKIKNVYWFSILLLHCQSFFQCFTNHKMARPMKALKL